MCFVDREKAFDGVSRKVVEWAMRKKEIPEMMVKVVMSEYREATFKIKVVYGYSDKFPVKISVHQGSVLPPFYLQL